MPELPEIETVRRHLEKQVVGKAIQDVAVGRPKTLNVAPDAFAQALTGRSFQGAERRGKVIRLRLPGGLSLLFHFMIDGYLRFFSPDEAAPEGANVTLRFDTGETLAFYRMHLGYVQLFADAEVEGNPDYAGLGQDPLDSSFDLEAWMRLLSARRGMIKPLLMDQKVIAGIGNVYSNEALFCSRILPARKLPTLSDTEKERLYHCLRTILAESVRLGGVSEDPFQTGDTFTGGYTSRLQVYDRAGQPCFSCSGLIETDRVGGRNAFFCPRCQR
ncbi:bifunctional DNA-formamidopyrimidine glycosylase/DNA-(apurinic or apyrimidinic site) lyase [Heliobacterium undosum]|uniref:Formamidopyrimidine-DNA glycosylase n=1 Tax=Heliomicrobium undosum TaxID=121734 RepID=A0A845L6H5_9FIRM|nr:bifunctional DNA-formamidopyrimidine glycosylase/DNA-(apurinic or apyrimidinic site) lyase [Heliomicrobium undosum]MZP30434.1 bifunctional DNA-formamidopyrimidine glycosylase/DNA-(apurinic or apyrimidinic site) lyase [Heliomicrobium undosum]